MHRIDIVNKNILPERYDIIPVICGDALHGVISPKSPALEPLVSLRESRRCRRILSEVGGPWYWDLMNIGFGYSSNGDSDSTSSSDESSGLCRVC